jgi:putative DNA methylase
MRDVARQLRKNPTPSEAILWQAIRKQQLDGRKFRRQMAIGPFVVDFYCSSERLAVEVDGPIHETQREADQMRQELIESLGIRFVRIKAEQVKRNLPQALQSIRATFQDHLHPPTPAGGVHPHPPTPAGGVHPHPPTPAGGVHPHPPTPSPITGEGAVGTDHPSPLVGEGPGKGGKSETVIAWLWARTVRCPNPACGAMMPLVRSFELSKKTGRRAWVEPVISPPPGGGRPGGGPRITFTVKSGRGKPPQGTVNRQGATCLACDTAVPFDHIRNEGKAGRMSAQLMAIVTEGSGGRSYYAPTPQHEQIANVPIPDSAPLTDLPEQALGFRVQLYGMTQHRDLFTPRQLTALTTFSDLVAEARQQIEADARAAWGEMPPLQPSPVGKMPPPQPSPAGGGSPDSSPQRGEVGRGADSTPLRDGGHGPKAYAEAVSVYLAFAVDRSADFWASLAFWANQPKNELVAHVFGRQALPMVWDFAEVNPFSSSGGNWLGNLEYIAKGVDNSVSSPILGKVFQADATRLDNHFSVAVSTDPPYYDNIGYADLSDYFYIWMRAALRQIFPEIFSTMLVPKEPELIASPYRFDGNKDASEKHFEAGLKRAFAEMRRIMAPDYPLTVYYAFKQQEIVMEEGTASTGWETMLTGLIETGFQIAGTWPMRTERVGRMIASGTNALASSIVLVCRPRPENAPLTSRREFVNALQRELPPALREMQSGNIAPVDLAQASIGPGMAVYSRYSQVLEPDGSRLTVRAALQLINHELDAYLAEQEDEIDADSRFAVAWFEQFGFKEAGFGQADVLARAKNTSVEGLANAGVLEAGAGKVRLIPWTDLDPGWDPSLSLRGQSPKQSPTTGGTASPAARSDRITVWEATHHLIERLNSHGESGAAMLLAKMAPDLAAEARQLAYRLYSICERKGWADHARDYNALVISWSASQEQAVRLKEQYQQGTLFE